MTPRLVEHLTRTYQRELALYNDVLELVEAEYDSLVRGCPLAEIIPSFERKRDLLRKIEEIDRAIACEKSALESDRRAVPSVETVELARAIDAVRGIVRRIIQLESRNEHELVRQAQGDPLPETMSESTGVGP